MSEMKQELSKARIASLERASQLDKSAKMTNAGLESAKSYDEAEYRQFVSERKKAIMKYFNASDADWNSHIWQMQNRIDNVETLNAIFKLDADRYAEIAEAGASFRWSTTPYYLSLMDANNPKDEIGLLAIPTRHEMAADVETSLDPMSEEYTNPAGSITRRYPDRLIINVTSTCAMLCRHCQRRRNFGTEDHHTSASDVEASIEYVRNTPYIRDVLITGGDPFVLDDSRLESIISELRKIPHVEFIRLGTRTSATLPQRVTDGLVTMLKKYHPIYVNFHFNHPKELTEDAIAACNKLADAGVPLGNQMVLLKGINDNKHVVMHLNRKMLTARVKPYYIFHPKSVEGTLHFCCDIEDGLKIMDHLTGNTSGMAKPYYIYNASGGLGKVPLLRSNFKKIADGKYEITTWEGNVVEFQYP